MIFTEETLATVSSILFEVTAEADPTLRQAKLAKVLCKVNGDELTLLELILSFILSGIMHAPKPRFNSIPYSNFTLHIGEWFTSQKTSEFYKLPHIVQTVLYFMSKASHIGLKTHHVATLNFRYVEPVTWLAENIILQDITINRCRLCNEQIADKDELCNNCKAGLSQWVHYRSENFTVKLTHKNCVWIALPIINHGNFTYNYQHYTISRIDLHTIQYTLNNKPTQLQLPIAEYQYSL